MRDKAVKIVIFGAGLIGCWVGGHLSRTADVTLVGRRSVIDHLGTGIRLSDYCGLNILVPPSHYMCSTDPVAMADADLIILTVKSGSTEEAARQIAAHAHPEAVILSLQNGVSNITILKDHLPGHQVVGGVIPFNIVAPMPGHFHRSTGTTLVFEESPALAPFDCLFGPAGLTVKYSSKIMGEQWGKLLLNLNNAVNALSGTTLARQLAEHGYRQAWALSLSEGLKLVRASGIAYVDPIGIPLRLLPILLKLPDWIYGNLGQWSHRPQFDHLAVSSMSNDLAKGRRTEVDYLQGEIVRLAERLGLRAPVNQRLIELVRAAESGAAPIPPRTLLSILKAAQSAR